MKVNEHLTDIVDVVTDGYHFVNLRFLLEDLENNPSPINNDVLKMVEQFSRLCKHVKGNA